MSRNKEAGFTLVELIITMTLIAVGSTIAYTFFNTSINQYLGLQQEGMSTSDLAFQSQRLASVMRGATDVVVAAAGEMTIHSYFSPNDAYVSQVRYYKSVDGGKLLADVTPFTTNPPIGTLDITKKRTITVIDNFHTRQGVSTFEYIDSSGGAMTLPVSDLHTIKGLRVNLVSQLNPADNSLSVQVSLRNRKTNL